MTTHYDAAEAYLSRAESLEGTSFESTARTLATIAGVHAQLAMVDAIRDLRLTATTTEVHGDLTDALAAIARDGAQDLVGRKLHRYMDGDHLEPMARANGEIREGLWA